MIAVFRVLWRILKIDFHLVGAEHFGHALALVRLIEFVGPVYIGPSHVAAVDRHVVFYLE